MIKYMVFWYIVDFQDLFENCNAQYMWYDHTITLLTKWGYMFNIKISGEKKSKTLLYKDQLFYYSVQFFCTLVRLRKADCIWLLFLRWAMWPMGFLFSFKLLFFFICLFRFWLSFKFAPPPIFKNNAMSL